MNYKTNFTRYTGKLHCLADGSLHFEVFLMQPPNCSIFDAIGTRNHAFNNCVVLDDNILSRLEMTIDWSHVHHDNYSLSKGVIYEES